MAWKSFKGIALLSIFLLLIQCSNKNNTKNVVSGNQSPKEKHFNYLEIVQPKTNANITIGQPVTFELKQLTAKKKQPDSVSLTINNTTLKLFDTTASLLTSELILPVDRPGTVNIRITSYFEGMLEVDYKQVVFLSDIIPEKYTYKILKTFPHQINAYTQGLVYNDGIMYEGTGQWGLSRLYKYDLSNGKTMKELFLSPQLFGEGIEVYDNKIIQLTYQAQKAFVYDKNTFEKIKEFKYPYPEGWGLTYDGQNLIMTDGSHLLYFLNKDYYSEVKRLEVYDNKGPIDSINEMEYVNGLLYANVYYSDIILCIDPKTGKVLRKINMSGLLKLEDKHPTINVLNGIAYNETKGTFYVTGKNWPKLFEVAFVKE